MEFNNKFKRRNNHKHLSKSRYNPIFIFISGIILILLLLSDLKSLILFLIISIAAGVLNYFIHIMDFHIHIGHVAFLMIVFSYALGFRYGILMIILAHIIPEIIAGHADKEMVITGVIYVLIAFLASAFNSVPIVTLGLILSFILIILSSFIESVTGTSIFELMTEHGIELIMLIIYFVSLSEFLVFLIR